MLLQSAGRFLPSTSEGLSGLKSGGSVCHMLRTLLTQTCSAAFWTLHSISTLLRSTFARRFLLSTSWGLSGLKSGGSVCHMLGTLLTKTCSAAFWTPHSISKLLRSTFARRFLPSTS